MEPFPTEVLRQFENICSLSETFSFTSPEGRSITSYYSSMAYGKKAPYEIITGEDHVVLTCEDRQIRFDENLKTYQTITDSQIDDLFTWLSATYSDEITYAGSLGVEEVSDGKRNLLIPFAGSRVLGVASINWETGEFSVSFQTEVEDDYDFIQIIKNGDQIYIIPTQERSKECGDYYWPLSFYSYDVATQSGSSRIGFVSEESIDYGDYTTDDGTPLSTITDQIMPDISGNPIIIGDELWVAVRPQIETEEGITALPLVFLSYDLETGELKNQYQPGIEGNLLGAISETNRFVIYTTNEEQGYGLSQFDTTTGEEADWQEMEKIISSYQNLSSDGRHFIFIDKVYTYSDETGLFELDESIALPQVELSSYVYNWKEEDDGTPHEYEAISAQSPHLGTSSSDAIAHGQLVEGSDDHRYWVYMGQSRDYVIVDTVNNKAYELDLPIDDSCYCFPYVVADADPYYVGNCPLEGGSSYSNPVMIQGSYLMINYLDSVYVYQLPSA